MKVLILGATGMVGQGVLQECLRTLEVTDVITLGRQATGIVHPKLQEIVLPDLFAAFESPQSLPLDVQAALGDVDLCCYSLGVSALGLDEAAYRRVNHDLTLAVAGVLATLAPRMAFVYVSGAGTDSSGQGRVMWARVKGQAENALRRLPFRAVYLFRPGVIVPMGGVRSKTALYQALYTLSRPLLGLARRLWPNTVTTTAALAQAMLEAARSGAPQPVQETADIETLVRQAHLKGLAHG